MDNLEKNTIGILRHPGALRKDKQALEKIKLRYIRNRRLVHHYLDFEKLITGLSTKFINLPADKIDQGINQALKAIAEFSGVDRSYIFMLQDGRAKVSNIYEWCAEGTEPQIHKLQDLSVEDFPWIKSKIMGLESVYVPRVSDMPQEAAAEKEICLAGSVLSLVCVPMVYQGAVVGFMGFDAVKAEKSWTQESIDLLKIVSEILVNVIESKKSAEELQKYRSCLEELVQERTAALEREIAERKRIEEELRKYHDHLEELAKERTLELELENEDRVKAEEALRVSEARYRAIIEDQVHFVCRWLPDGTLTFINEAYCRYFGKKRDELINTSFMPMIPEEDRQIVKDSIAALNRDNPAGTCEHRVILPAGQVRWQQWTNRAIFDEQGKVVEFQSVGDDITERRFTRQALEDSERFLSNIFSSIQDGISILDTDLNIIRVNSVVEKWQAHAMPLVGKKCHKAYHSSDLPCAGCPSRQTLQTGNSAYAVIPKSGPGGKTVGWLELYTFPLMDADTGKLKGIIEYTHDITGRKKSEEEKAALDKELMKSNKRLKQLTLMDPHTGLYNHRYLQEIIEAEFDRSRRYAQPLSVMMLDIDYFRSINDVYGHKFGDLVLKQFAKILKRMVRRYDTVIRYGGEEFVILCSGTDRANALSLAKRILDAINLFDFGNKKHSVKLKLSIAVVSYNEDRALKGINLVELADQILSRVKESGGNRVYSSLDIKKAGPHYKINKNGNIKFLNEKIEKLSRRANQSLMEAIFAFAKTIEVKDHYTGEHVERTVKYATGIARAMNLPERDIELIRQAAMLHDLGKIGISEKILLKKGKLTKQEFAEIRKHPQIGVDIIRPIHFLHPIIPILLYHHERWDGKGYPNSLKGTDIPVGARIVAIADVYQALISDRCYRKAYPQEKAIEIIREESGKLFDPEIVDAFLRIVHTVD
ncbi:MAG: diguanylate cyclase [Candidatus Omnitrophica bacterium]|nr:diguanylate cyclase [Candidatus Omnitrophota bacterium]